MMPSKKYISDSVNWDHNWIYEQLERLDNAYAGFFKELYVEGTRPQGILLIRAVTNLDTVIYCSWRPEIESPFVILWKEDWE